MVVMAFVIEFEPKFETLNSVSWVISRNSTSSTLLEYLYYGRLDPPTTPNC